MYLQIAAATKAFHQEFDKIPQIELKVVSGFKNLLFSW